MDAVIASSDGNPTRSEKGEGLVTMIARNPVKQRAWAYVQHIRQPNQIRK